MKMEITTRGYYQILRIEEELAVIADLSELTYLVKGYLKQGKRHIAVSFTDASYIYSGALAVLIECYKELSEGEGELCIIEPNQNLKDIFASLNINKVLNVYESEEDLPA
ncbi:MAG: STAS domain-containing protein [Chitinivibrionales bacterium]|nr:STAS domain-containing protein [Chitinivibrionales bacterium]MBD3394181.1 STAS domain-containing protein [Chitinivibrionales bacterium]